MVRTQQRCSGLGLLALGLACQGVGAGELSEAAYLDSGDVTVLTASRLAQPIMDAPNAITVLDRATIQASGYHNLSDLFRLVPGMYVGQQKGWYHNVSHTMADEFSRRMQVLVDGRSVYLPSFGGVRWDTLPLAIDDIERIEVVRGPNAATFGANAMTGVINIITRHPQDVGGGMLHLITGDHDHREGWFRWAGGGGGASHRVTLGHREDDGFALQNDDERSNIASYRGEFHLDGGRALSVQAGIARGEHSDGEADPGATRIRNAVGEPHVSRERSLFLQTDYRQDLGDERGLSAKAYFTESNSAANVSVVPGPKTLVTPGPAYWDIPPGTSYELGLDSRRWHVEAQLDQQVEADLRTAFGGFLRRDAVRSAHFFNEPGWLNVDSWGVFAHMEKRLHTDWLLNLGAFWEDYELVGGRISPRLSLNWQPTAHQTIRFGVSRAYRNPVLFEAQGDWMYRFTDSLGTPIPGPGLSYFNPLVASGGLKPEDILTKEISYLANWPETGLSLDARIFQERINNFIGFDLGDFPIDFANYGDIRQEGLEAQVKWHPGTSTQILANYAFLRIDNQVDGNRYSPPHLAGLHVMHEFPGKVQMTLSHYWIGAFQAIGQGPIPTARRWDARISKRFDLGQTRAELAFAVLNGGDPYFEFDNGKRHVFDTRGYVHLKLDF